MRNTENWTPTKYVAGERGLAASTDPRQVGEFSRLAATLTARALEQLIRQHTRGRLLDLGCGRMPLYQVYGPRCEWVVGADWPMSPHPLDHHDVVCDLSRPLPFAEGSFDTVLLTDVLEHIADPTQLVAEIGRVLAPGGCLIATVPFMYWIHEAPHDYHRYTEYALKRFARSAGLDVAYLQPYGGGGDVAVDILAKVIHPIHWRIGPPLARFAQASWLRVREHRWMRWSRDQWHTTPLGYAFVFGRPPVSSGAASQGAAAP